MPPSETRPASEAFYRRLDELKAKIDSVAEQYRPQLREALATARRQQEQVERNCANVRDVVADIGLVVEHAKFHVAACRRELRELDPQRHAEL